LKPAAAIAWASPPDDGARHFQAGDVGRARRHRVVAGALQHVGPVDAAGGDADQQFAGARDRVGALSEAQHLGGAVLVISMAFMGSPFGLSSAGRPPPSPETDSWLY
jgi:hypothetical protein